MAEIMVLTLFILLLLIAATMERSKKEIAQNVATIEEQRQRIDILLPYEKLVIESPNGVVVKDIVQELKRQEGKIEDLKAEIQRLTPFESSAKSVETIIAELSKGTKENPTKEQIVDKINKTSDLIRENENLRGQIAQLSSQIKKSGRGNEFPSCWVTPDGKPESIFDLLIGDSGIRITERDPPYQIPPKSELPLAGIRYDTDLLLHEFDRAVLPLYHWSVAHQCRFYVIIASSDRSAPIHFVNAVNGYFYPDSKIQFRPGRT
jgi:hypothetical protein